MGSAFLLFIPFSNMFIAEDVQSAMSLSAPNQWSFVCSSLIGLFFMAESSSVIFCDDLDALLLIRLLQLYLIT